MSKLTIEIEDKEYHISDIMTIENYIKFYKIKDFLDEKYFQAKMVSSIAGVPMEKVMEVGHNEITYISNHILSTFPDNKYPFYETFELDGIEYGFIPSWKRMSFAEFIDLDTIMNKKPNEVMENLHILCAIMYRPIISKKSKHEFEIETYDVFNMEQRAELFRKKLDVKYVLGGNFFFSNFVNKYSVYSQQSLWMRMKIWFLTMRITWKLRKQIWKGLFHKHSGGMQYSIVLQEMILQNITKFRKKQS